VTINIISKLEGGLGNQLFQYAFAKKISCDLNCNLILDIGITSTQSENRKINLFNYMIDCKTISSDPRMSQYPEIAIKDFDLKNIDIITENKSLDVLERALKISKNTYLIGWWQSYKYIDSIKDILKEEVYPKYKENSSFNKAKIWINSKNNTVAIHIRRGDFINTNFGILPKSYYFDALKLLMKKISNPEIIYFSDDPEWVKLELASVYEGHIISSKWDLREYEELVLMSLCDHHIIANSSFSWWGCWLKKNEDGISIRPSRWFAKSNDIVNEEDICPKTWLIVPVRDEFITKPNKWLFIRNLKDHLFNYFIFFKFKFKKIFKF
jgi:hypothetical protein